MTDRLLSLIDKKDIPIGTIGKLEAHLGDGVRHRAFTAIVVNEKKELLITKRSLLKPLWPTFWDISFSSHPFDQEDILHSVVRRSVEELGVSLEKYSLKDIGSYEYHIRWNEFFSEWEINHLVLCTPPLETSLACQLQLHIDPNEISEFFWLPYKDLPQWIEKEKKNISPWVIESYKRKLLENL